MSFKKEAGEAFANALQIHFADDFFKAIPHAPGVYFMRCERGKILYIGKAKSLRKRVRSYRQARPGVAPRNVVALVRRVRKINWEICESEEAAFRRERELIRAVVPRYNIADAWQEDYLYIGLAAPATDKLRFFLGSEEDFSEELDFHGCYLQRRLTKQAYSALIRLLFASEHRKDRFYFPAKLARPAPIYDYTLKIDEAETWKRLLSGFLHGNQSPLIKRLVDALLSNEYIPVFLRGRLQKDLDLVKNFGRNCRATRLRLGLSTRIVSQSSLRESILRSLDHESLAS